MFLDSPEARAYAADPVRARRCARRSRGGEARYAAEVAYAYPAQADRLVGAHLDTVGDLLPYAYPLFQLPVAVSRAHRRAQRRSWRAAIDDARCRGRRSSACRCRCGRVPVDAGAVAALPARHWASAPTSFVVGVLRPAHPREARRDGGARGARAAAADFPALRLLARGARRRAAAARRACCARAALRERTIVAGRVPLAELPVHIEAADLVVHLRYPTARETSAALLRVLAQGRPTVISDLEQLRGDPGRRRASAPTSSDEEGAVTRAILRLAGGPRCAIAWARRARARSSRARATRARAEAYVEAIERAAPVPIPRRTAGPRTGRP